MIKKVFCIAVFVFCYLPAWCEDNNLLIKVGVDVSGAINGTVSAVGAGSAVMPSFNTDTGVTLGIESLFPNKGTSNLGIGLAYQIPRNALSFTTAYGIFKSKLSDNNYFVGHLGYSLIFAGDTNNNSLSSGISAKWSGDIYYGIGLGFNINRSVLELMYSVHKGKGSFPYAGYDMNLNIDYSKITISYGFGL